MGMTALVGKECEGGLFSSDGARHKDSGFTCTHTAPFKVASTHPCQRCQLFGRKPISANSLSISNRGESTGLKSTMATPPSAKANASSAVVNAVALHETSTSKVSTPIPLVFPSSSSNIIILPLPFFPVIGSSIIVFQLPGLTRHSPSTLLRAPYRCILIVDGGTRTLWSLYIFLYCASVKCLSRRNLQNFLTSWIEYRCLCSPCRFLTDG